jgi:hypothetical protein
MDIMTQGDMAITNKDNMTTFSFRVPSLEKIDFGQTRTDYQEKIIEKIA